jgi:hypothetical protein
MKNEPIVGGRPVAEGQDEFHNLSVRFEPDKEFQFADGSGRTYTAPYMTTRWKPSPEELTCLLNGGSLYLGILGNRYPPMMLWAE